MNGKQCNTFNEYEKNKTKERKNVRKKERKERRKEIKKERKFHLYRHEVTIEQISKFSGYTDRFSISNKTQSILFSSNAAAVKKSLRKHKNILANSQCPKHGHF